MKLARVCCFFISLVLSCHAAERIVSLSPAITETLYALGCGDALVGNTRFCDYPAAALKVAKVGGFLDLNLEALIALQPTVVFCNPEHKERLAPLAGRVDIVYIAHERLADVYNGISVMAKRLHMATAGAALNKSLRLQLDDIAAATAGQPRMAVLCVIGRNPDALDNMIAAGRSMFLSELLEIAGARNAYRGNIAYPSLTSEAVLAIKPDYILEMSAFYEGIAEPAVRAAWQPWRQIPAVAAGHIAFIHESFWLRPGPRIVDIARQLQRLFHHAAT